MTDSVHERFLAKTFGLSGKRALVTGGSSGIGQAIALGLAQAGAEVVIAARDQARLDAAAQQLRATGAQAECIAADLATRAGAHALADTVGEADIVVHSAGINLRPPMAELDEDVWDATMRVNLDAAFILGQRLAPGMATRGYGRLIHISSQQAHRPFAASGAYGVSKAAIEGLARSQAEAWSPHGVTANAIVPGFVPTPLNERMSSNPELVAQLAARTLIGRNSVPQDFVGVAVFLASPASAYITGQSIHVDGGFSVH